MIDYKEYITINSEIRFGKPIIEGTRIAVSNVLNWLANGITINEILQDFPELSEVEVNSCLAFSFNNKEIFL
jgi:uncharacterized protein (DUF433 family)